MSEQSWLDEFYPTPASDFAGSTDLIAATKHSLQKWKGALPENLKKHGLEDKPIGYDGASCALCIAFYDSTLDAGMECSECPVVLSGKPGCDEGGSAYSKRRLINRVPAMIATLQKALTYLENQQ